MTLSLHFLISVAFKLKHAASGVRIGVFLSHEGCLLTFQFSQKKLNAKRKKEKKKGPLMKDLYLVI